MKKIAIIVVCIALTGCAGAYTSQTQSQLNTAAKRELAAWAEVQKAYDTQCPHGSRQKPIAREKAVESNQCYEDLARKNVMPVAVDMTEVNRFLIANEKTAIEYKQGKIDADEKALRVQENWTNYIATMDAKGNAVINTAAQQDAQLAQQRQQYFQNLSTQLNQAQAQANTNAAAMPMPQPPIQTHCYKIGNQMNCTTQ